MNFHRVLFKRALVVFAGLLATIALILQITPATSSAADGQLSTSARNALTVPTNSMLQAGMNINCQVAVGGLHQCRREHR